MKRLVSGGIAVMLLLAAAVGIVIADDSDRAVKNESSKAVQEQAPTVVQQQVANVNESTSQAQSSSTILTSKEAIEIAKNEVDGIVKELELEREKGRMVYEIEMHTGTKEVDLKIDASTGEIVKIEEEWDNDRKYKTLQNKQAAEQNNSAPAQQKTAKQSDPTPAQNANTKQTTPVVEQNKPVKETKVEHSKAKPAQTKKADREVIGTAEAVRIAKTIADGKLDEVELDREDGRLIYEVEIENRKYEVEIEIDAYTGEILDVEYDD